MIAYVFTNMPKEIYFTLKIILLGNLFLRNKPNNIIFFCSWFNKKKNIIIHRFIINKCNVSIEERSDYLIISIDFKSTCDRRLTVIRFFFSLFFRKSIE